MNKENKGYEQQTIRYMNRKNGGYKQKRQRL